MPTARGARPDGSNLDTGFSTRGPAAGVGARRPGLIVAPLPAGPPIPTEPVTSVAEAVAPMAAIGAALPASDGLAEATALASRLLTAV